MTLEIQDFTGFEAVAKRLTEQNFKNYNGKQAVHKVLLQVFKHGFDLGRNGKIKVEA